MRGHMEQMDCFGRLVPSRAPHDVHHQFTVCANRDRLYSFGRVSSTAAVMMMLRRMRVRGGATILPR